MRKPSTRSWPISKGPGARPKRSMRKPRRFATSPSARSGIRGSCEPWACT
jgi:hypothetical protein